MFKILKGGKIFDPEMKGDQDLLIADTVIANMSENISPVKDYGEVEVIDVSGKFIVPGFIDQHVHLIGGGGEGGYATRTPEVMLSAVITEGITTVIGCLGTDGITRHMTSLLAKARGLENEGISTYIYTGAYQVPTSTIMNCVRDDMVIIDKVIGCGEIAMSDHRSAQPSKEEIIKLAAESRVGGILSGKAGVLHLHVGDGAQGIQMLFEIVHETEIPVTQFRPTHVNRNKKLLEQAIKFAKLGGIIDVTSSCGPEAGMQNAYSASQGIRYCLDQGVDIKQITMSSDGNGSMPRFNENGEIVGLTVAGFNSLYEEFKKLVQIYNLNISDALKVITQNPAQALKLYPQKGTIKIGSHADIVVLDSDLKIDMVFAKGRCIVSGGKPIIKGTFEI